MADLLLRTPDERASPAFWNGVSVAVDETAREVSERQVLPADGLRERLEQ
jgi:hypothetical protein